jgi:hypothetical protein
MENLMKGTRNDPGANYTISVQGRLDQGWQDWFDGLTVATTQGNKEAPTTTLTGRVADQAALRGMLCKLWDLNLVLASVQRIEEEE